MCSFFWLKRRAGKGDATGTFGSLVIGLSYYAAGMGGWVLFAAPEVGAQFGLIGLLGYAIVCCLPMLLIIFLGPFIKLELEGQQAFALTDWVRMRFGRGFQIYVSLVSLAYMAIFMCVELVTFASVFEKFAGIPTGHSVAALSVLSCTVAGLGGLSTSLLSQAVQGTVCAALLLSGVVYALHAMPDFHGVHVDIDVSKSTTAVGSLFLAVTGAELMNMTEWQRVWSAKDPWSLKCGLIIAICLVFCTISGLGIIGYLHGTSATAFLDVMESGGLVPSVIMTVAILGLCTSTVDALQQAAVSLISKSLQQRHALFTIAAFCILNATTALAACYLSFSLMQLFLIADLLATCAAVPIFLGLFNFVTSRGAAAGCVSALITVFFFGLVHEGTVIGGLERFTVPGGLYATETLWLFSSAVAVSAFITVAVSKLT